MRMHTMCLNPEMFLAVSVDTHGVGHPLVFSAKDIIGCAGQCLFSSFLPLCGPSHNPCSFTQDSLSLSTHKWELHNATLRYYFHKWDTPWSDLFSTCENLKLPLYCSRGAMGEDSQGDALLLLWTGNLRYAFPPIPLLPQVLRKIHWNRTTVILITLFWPHQFWFTDLLRLSIHTPLCLQTLWDLLIQDQCWHPNLPHPNLIFGWGSRIDRAYSTKSVHPPTCFLPQTTCLPRGQGPAFPRHLPCKWHSISTGLTPFAHCQNYLWTLPTDPRAKPSPPSESNGSPGASTNPKYDPTYHHLMESQPLYMSTSSHIGLPCERLVATHLSCSNLVLGPLIHVVLRHCTSSGYGHCYGPSHTADCTSHCILSPTSTLIAACYSPTYGISVGTIARRRGGGGYLPVPGGSSRCMVPICIPMPALRSLCCGLDCTAVRGGAGKEMCDLHLLYLWLQTRVGQWTLLETHPDSGAWCACHPLMEYK
ncbi:uncharacterized protein LOC122465823 [Chelonia mydas]|uniref:uncharacterized protein LOC122465823 n=1 Tax=Chelonia mydas TaxID=8469 RepID=UPI001CA9C3FD|nr:uncharacterized protein LOC122465823 [Chelonia mydas]